ILENGRRLSFIKDYRVINNQRLTNNHLKNNAYCNIFNNWTDPYCIGFNNGPKSKKYSHPKYTQQWANVNINYSYTLPLPAIDTMVEKKNNFILALRAACAAGKTVGIRPYLEAHPALRVLIVANRVSLANKSYDSLQDLGYRIYLDEQLKKGMIFDEPLLIVSYNSMWKVIGEYDLVILDEYNSLMEMQFSKILKKKR